MTDFIKFMLGVLIGSITCSILYNTLLDTRQAKSIQATLNVTHQCMKDNAGETIMVNNFKFACIDDKWIKIESGR